MLIVASTVVAFLWASVGVLPSPRMIESLLLHLRLAGTSAGGDPTERFPCEGCACGCGSAQECWSNCCCHTEQERIQWAIDRGVEPPASVRPSLLARFMRAKQEQAGRIASAMAAQRDAVGSAELPPCCRARVEKASAANDGCCTTAGCSASVPSRSLGPCISPLGCKGVASALFAVTLPPAIPTAPLDCRWPDPGVWVARCEPVFDFATRALDADAPPPRGMMA
jgi:hypothetical protein